MKSAEYLLCPLRREIALNVGDDQNQNTEQYHYFDRVVDEELNTAAYFSRGVKSAEVEQPTYQTAEPLHTKDFVLKEIPYSLYHLHNASDSQIEIYLYLDGFVSRAEKEDLLFTTRLIFVRAGHFGEFLQALYGVCRPLGRN